MIWPGPRTEGDLWMGFVDRYRNKYQTGGLQHLLARQIREEIGAEAFDSYFKFALVRNPFDRAVSQFAYMRKREDLRGFVGMEADTSFADYLELIGTRRHVQWEPQSSFLLDDSSELLVDSIARFESIGEDLQPVLARLGIGRSRIPHANASARGPYREYYTPHTRARVEAMYGDDIERFGYSF